MPPRDSPLLRPTCGRFNVPMTIFIIFFMPETKGVPVERVQVLFARHW